MNEDERGIVEAVKKNRVVLVTLLGLLMQKGILSEEELEAVLDAGAQALEIWDELGEFGILRSGGTD